MKLNLHISSKKISLIAIVCVLTVLPIKALYAQESSGTQQQGTFDFSNEQQNTSPVSNTPGPGIPTEPPITDTPLQGDCRPPVTDLNPIYSIGGLKFGWASYTVWGNETRRAKGGYWYYIPQTIIEDAVLQTNLESILKTLEGQTPDLSILDASPTPAATLNQSQTTAVGQQQATFNVTPDISLLPTLPVSLGELKIRKQEKIIKDILRIGESCPLRLTGSSPTLFLYGTDMQYTIHSDAILTYTDPVVDDNTWIAQTTDTKSLTINGIERPYIYYEYEPVQFAKPEEGWVINKSTLSQFVRQTLIAGLGLNEIEAERALFELKHATQSIKGNNIYIGLISQEEVNQKIPITITPDPTSVYRLHFYIDAATDGENPKAPLLYSIQRTDSMAIELGSYAAK